MSSSSSTLAPIADLGMEKTKTMLDLVRNKLKSLNSYTDDILPEYVIVLLGNKHGKSKIREDLDAFLESSLVDHFTDWLFDQYDYLLKNGKPMPVYSVVEKRLPRSSDKGSNSSGERHYYYSDRTIDRYHQQSSNYYNSERHHYSRSDKVTSDGKRYNPNDPRDAEGDVEMKSRSRSKSPILSQSRRSSTVSITDNGHQQQQQQQQQNSSSLGLFSIGEFKFTDARQYLMKKRNQTSSASANNIPTANQGSGAFLLQNNDASLLIASSSNNSNSNSNSATGIAVRCQYYPNCKSGDSCPFVHPTEPCKFFPNCTFGTQCLYIHPALPCKFQDRCQNPSCNYQHASPATLMHRPRPTKNPYLPPSTIICRFHPKCLNHACPFVHPSDVPCKYAEKCQRPGCSYLHPANHNRSLIKTKVMAPCRFANKCANSHCPFEHQISSLSPTGTNFIPNVAVESNSTLDSAANNMLMNVDTSGVPTTTI